MRFDNPRVPYRASALYAAGRQPSNTIPRQEQRPRQNVQQRQEPRQQEATYKQEFGQRRGNNRQEPWQQPVRPRQRNNYDQRPGGGLFCKSCNTQGHSDLFNCPKFPEYIPRGTNVKSLPKWVCPKCLSYYMNCDHRQFKGFEDYLCKKYDVNFLVCNQCAHHTTAQDWAKKNFNPSDENKILSRI